MISFGNLLGLVALVGLLGLVRTSQFYSNGQATECFTDKAMHKCQEHFDTCLWDNHCQNELELYNQCTFGSSLDESEHIFNGYCFQRWQHHAEHTSHIINCLTQVCDLDYNSELGVTELYHCSEWIMFEEDVECGEDCLVEMGQKIGEHLLTAPVLDLYSQTMIDSQAQALTQLILEECIADGKGREMIYSEESLRAQLEWSKIAPKTSNQGHPQEQYFQGESEGSLQSESEGSLQSQSELL